LPWTLFLPQALLVAAKWRQHPKREGWWFVLCWLVTILGFFSLSTGKRDIYILPAFPAAALLVGWFWSHAWQRSRHQVAWWSLGLPTLVLALTLCGLAVLIWGSADGVLPGRWSLLLPATRAVGVPGSLLLFLGGIILASAALAQRSRLMYASIVGCAWLAMLMTTVWIYIPQFNQRYPIQSFSAAVHNHRVPDRPLQLCGPMNDLAVRFNLGYFVPALHHPAEIMQYLSGAGEAYCVIEAESYQRLGELTGQWFPIITHQEFDGTSLLLISNR
jgi:4-amino-4-deoxy-L-arabinose transferase-like glycosyltransferase